MTPTVRTTNRNTTLHQFTGTMDMGTMLRTSMDTTDTIDRCTMVTVEGEDMAVEAMVIGGKEGPVIAI